MTKKAEVVLVVCVYLMLTFATVAFTVWVCTHFANAWMIAIAIVIMFGVIAKLLEHGCTRIDYIRALDRMDNWFK